MPNNRRADPRPCATCGQPFQPLVRVLRHGKGLYCSLSCAAVANMAKENSVASRKRGTGWKSTDRVCPACGTVFRKAGSSGTYCSRRCMYAGRRPSAPPWQDRFWARVDKSGPVVRPELGPCWVWTGQRATTGYGSLSRNRRPYMSHRLSWELHFGEIPEGTGAHGVCVLHRCDNRLCVNPAHLFLGSQADNVRDMDAKGRRVTRHLRHEQHPRAKLASADVAFIRERYAQGGVTHRDLARKYGVDRTTVTAILRGVNWRPHYAALDSSASRTRSMPTTATESRP